MSSLHTEGENVSRQQLCTDVYIRSGLFILSVLFSIRVNKK